MSYRITLCCIHTQKCYPSGTFIYEDTDNSYNSFLKKAYHVRSKSCCSGIKTRCFPLFNIFLNFKSQFISSQPCHITTSILVMFCNSPSALLRPKLNIIWVGGIILLAYTSFILLTFNSASVLV